MKDIRMKDEDLQTRLARLESRQRRLALVFVGGAVLLLAAGTSTNPAPGAIEAREVRIVDEASRTRIALRVGDDGPMIALKDEEGRDRAVLTHGSDGTMLYLKDAEGQVRVGTAQFAHGGGGFALHGPGAKGAAVLYLKESGTLTFFDAEGNVAWRAPESN